MQRDAAGDLAHKPVGEAADALDDGRPALELIADGWVKVPHQSCGDQDDGGESEQETESHGAIPFC